MAWPPTLADLKVDMKIAANDTRDDAQLQQALDAAVAFVARVRRSSYNFDRDLGSFLPDPALAPDLILGTLRLARRWKDRARSPAGIIEMADLGAARVSSGDADIDRLLRIGRHLKPAIG